MIISADAEKKLTKSNSYSLLKKTLSKLRIKGNYFKSVKSIYKGPMANIIFDGERLNVFILRSGTRQALNHLLHHWEWEAGRCGHKRQHEGILVVLELAIVLRTVVDT